LEEFNKLSHAYDELKELWKTCPCHEEPRPSHIVKINFVELK